jgi:cellulose synthase/poly-beta-1,6-N-acetylglucosamine synthase-like glycosyltransferase
MIGGTAFAWRSSERVRFNDKCLVEDLDLSLRLHRARASMVYRDLDAWDEKPSSLKVSLIQRLRWSRGGWWLLFHGRFWTWRIDDVAAALGTLGSLLWGLSLAVAVVRAPVAVLFCVAGYMIMGAAGLLKLDQLDRFRWSLIYSIPLMSILEGCLSVAALFTWKQGSWVRTRHSSSSGLLEREWKERQEDRAVGA